MALPWKCPIDLNPKYTGPPPPAWYGSPPRILTPGASKSGFRMAAAYRLGPRDEEKATVGARVTPTTVPGVKSTAALGSGRRI